MSDSLDILMQSVKQYGVLPPKDERELFERLDQIYASLITEVNKTAAFYNRIPGLMFVISNGHEPVKNIVKTHKHTGNITEFVVDVLEEYQSMYQRKVIHKDPTDAGLLDNISLSMHLDYDLVKNIANEVQMYTGENTVIDLHVSSEDLYKIQVNLAGLLAEQRNIENKLANHNMRLVVKLAKQIHYETCGVMIHDLVQEGSVALLKAMHRFDVTTGNKFSTMATYWIDSSMRRYIQNHGKAIRVPVNVQDHLAKALKEQEKLTHQLGRQPTDREMANHLGLSIDRYKEILDSQNNIMSIDKPTGDEDEGMTLADVIEDVSAGIECQLFQQELQSFVIDAMDQLTPQELEVIRMRHGFDQYEPMSLGECAQELGCSKPTVLSRENKALEKMKKYLFLAIQDQNNLL